MPAAILPGATIGILGGGQLGRMLCNAARSMGYRIAVLDPDQQSPAGSIADLHLCAAYDDNDALDQLATAADVITVEFENIPAASVHYLAARCRVYPDANALEIAQHRAREKTFASEAGLTPAPYAIVSTTAELEAALQHTGSPALLKTATLGYDGKGQRVVASLAEAEQAFADMGAVECVLEQLVDIASEISVIIARNADGELASFPPAENIHINNILHTSTVPASVDQMLLQRAVEQASALASRLQYVGVLAVEFFVTAQGELLFNEMAPRTHNSGHYTEDACMTSQFEQQVRMVCGLPPGDTRLLTPVVMVNMLGDLWEPDWQAILQPDIKLHLYGKRQARPGRKMGHFNVMADSAGQALVKAKDVFSRLTG